jgi:hypothetical protein
LFGEKVYREEKILVAKQDMDKIKIIATSTMHVGHKQ